MLKSITDVELPQVTLTTHFRWLANCHFSAPSFPATGEFPGEAGTLYLTGLMYLIRVKLKVAAGWEVSPQTNGPREHLHPSPVGQFDMEGDTRRPSVTSTGATDRAIF